MNYKIFSFLKKYSTEPLAVDRLIVSAFCAINNLSVNRNKLVKFHLIGETNSTENESKLRFIEVLKNNFDEFTFEHLIELFEFVISPGDRIINGAIYTPLHVREFILDQTFAKTKKQIETISISDISCGCGGFLFTAAKKLKTKSGKDYKHIFEQQIFGLDIQEYSIRRCKLLLSLLAISEGDDSNEYRFNLYVDDALNFKWETKEKQFVGFDIIAGNPPYVCARNLSEDVRNNLKHWSVCKTGNPDLYIPFFQIGYENLATNGVLGFITMNTFFKSLNGRALRQFFHDRKTEIKIIDFGTYQIFRSKSTYTCICFFTKNSKDHIDYYRSTLGEFPVSPSQFSQIPYKKIDVIKGWNFVHNDLISKIETVGIPFGKRFKTRQGIATLKNEVYIFTPVAEDKQFYYLDDGEIYKIEKAICKEIVNSNRLNENATIDHIVEKLIYPYTNDAKPQLLKEYVLKKRFPFAHKYLLSKKKILSTRDRGKAEYEDWFAFGRTQSLERTRNKLFFPKITNKIPECIINDNADLFFYNGQAVVGHSKREMLLAKRLMESRMFWFYISNTSKPYMSGYMSIDGNYIRNFGVYEFTDQELDYICSEEDKSKIDNFLEEKYRIKLPILNP